MDKISPTLLNDTLKLVQLARETARAQGSNQQAEKLEPVVEKLQNLVNDKTSKPAASQGLMGQSDFQILLNASQNKSSEQQTQAVSTSSVEDRNHMVSAMASGGMSDVDIARQFGMTREEVKMILNLADLGSKR
jgi:hypothetical protein